MPMAAWRLWDPSGQTTNDSKRRKGVSMRRSRTLAIGLVLTAATVLLLAYAANRLVYLFTFDQDSGSAAVDSKDGKVAGSRFSEITLSWDAVPNALSYNLYWSTRPKVTRLTGKRIPGVMPPYRFTEVEKGVTYYFVVTAVTEAGESRESEEIVYRAKP